MSIVDLIQRNANDIVIASALGKTLPGAALTCSINTINYIFPQGPKPAKAISLQLPHLGNLPGVSYFESLCNKLWNIVKRILECFGVTFSKPTVNKDLLIDCVLEINQAPNRKELLLEECKKIAGSTVHIFVSRENPRIDRAINIV